MSWKMESMNVEQNDVRPYMSELTNATMMDLTQTSTKIPQMIDIPRPMITLVILYRLVVSSLYQSFSSQYKHTQQN